MLQNTEKTVQSYRLLNVLCTFNLRPVSTGKEEPWDQGCAFQLYGKDGNG